MLTTGNWRRYLEEGFTLASSGTSGPPKSIFQTPEKLAAAKPGAKVMHPGPMNRGVEIDSSIADDKNLSMIQDQVEMGVAVRMAVLDALSHYRPGST